MQFFGSLISFKENSVQLEPVSSKGSCQCIYEPCCRACICISYCV